MPQGPIITDHRFRRAAIAQEKAATQRWQPGINPTT